MVVRSDWKKDKVAIITGGGAGHEPADVGMVGPGLLTAVVCGDIFASPSVDAVADAVAAVTGPAGCLVIVRNYIGQLWLARHWWSMAVSIAMILSHKPSWTG